MRYLNANWRSAITLEGRQYIVPIKLGSRTFLPRPFTTLLAVVLIAMLIALGRWQLRRAEEKRALFDAFAAGADATLLIDIHTPKVRRYQHVEASGHYVVVIGYDSDRLYLQDPSVGPTAISFENFAERWHDKDDAGKRYVRYGISFRLRKGLAEARYTRAA